MPVFNEPSTLDADYGYGSNDEFNFLREVFAGSNLNDKERQLLMSVEQGDLDTVRRLLTSVTTIAESEEDEDEDVACDVQPPTLVVTPTPAATPIEIQKANAGALLPGRASSKRQGMNVNCVDPRGRSSVMIAIDNENIEMLALLLKHGLDTADAIKHAVLEQNVAAVELLLNTDSANRRNAVHSSSFSSDVTCLMLAAHLDNYELISLLLHYGDRLVRPHDVMCRCCTCKQQSGDDFLNSSLSRFHLYQALASPYLIVLTSRDPLLTAFRLSGELKRLALLENEFHEDYKALACRCDNFAVEMLDQVRGLSDLEVILNFSSTHYAGDSRHYGHGDAGAEDDSSDDDERDLKRFRVAIQYKQKKFVAHPNCQQLIAARWYDGLPGYRRRNDVTRLMTMVTIGLMHPIFCALYVIWPCGPVGRFLRRPFVNCICHGASYLVFVFFIIVASQRFDFIGYVMALSEDAQQRRMVRDVQGPPPTSEEWIIIVYVIGFVASQMRELWDVGGRTFMRDMWSILDCITNALYITTFTLKFAAYYRVEKEKSETYGSTVEQNLPNRKDWSATDPNLIAEGLFAVANIFSALKLLQVFTLHPKLGPLQISLGRMVLDIARFGAIALLVALAYAFGINQLYWYYSEARKITCANCRNASDDSTVDDSCLEACDKSLDSLFEIIQTLYFAIYGLVERRTFEVRDNHTFTQFIGRLMFGTYCGIMVVVMLNMLVAILSNSFQNIWDDADTEWKYARSKFWISYFRKGVVLPPPYNLIPTPFLLTYVSRGLDLIFRTLCATQSPFTSSEKHIRIPVQTKEAEYQAVMEKLVRRYVSQRQKVAMSGAITIDDVSEVKQDISAMRHEMLGLFRTNGFKVPSTAVRTGQLGGKRRGAMSLNRLFQGSGHAPLATTQSGSSSLNTPTSVTFIDDSPFKRRLSSQHLDSRTNKSRRVSFS